ncbi:MAG: hypothetical protein AB7V46_09870 [Thermomicrobiales bacterium]
MKPPRDSFLSSEPADDLYRTALELASKPEFLLAWNSYEQDTRGKTRFDKHLAGQGLELPEGLQVIPLGFEGKPGPDFIPWTIRLTNCRTFYVSDEPGEKPREHTVCFGIEILPTRIPGGPIG